MVTIGACVKEPGSSRNNKTEAGEHLNQFWTRKCIDCENCVLFCPEGCINKDYDIDYDYCKGCGICAEECPVEAIKMERG